MDSSMTSIQVRLPASNLKNETSVLVKKCLLQIEKRKSSYRRFRDNSKESYFFYELLDGEKNRQVDSSRISLIIKMKSKSDR